MTRIKTKNKKNFLLIIPPLILLFLIACTLAVYNGILPLNYPSKTKYPVRGVDVSHYQGDIDWNELAGNSIKFAFIKATEGSSSSDEKFNYNWEEAGKTGLKTGAYHFFSFDSPGETQAGNFISKVPKQKGMLPPVIDVEYYADKRNNPPSKEALLTELKVLYDTLKEYYGVEPVIYTTKELWDGYLAETHRDSQIWIRNVISSPDRDINWRFWQYSNRGKLTGYTGEEKFIDLNLFNGTEKEWESWLEEYTVK